MTGSKEVARLQSIVDRQLDFIRAYKARQDRIVAGLTRVAESLPVDAADARAAMGELLATDLKQSQERVANWTMTLRVAEKALRECVNTKESRAAVAAIHDLAPEAFEAAVAGVKS